MRGVGSQALACLVVVLFHLLLWKMVTQSLPAPKSNKPLMVIWIDPPQPRAIAPSTIAPRQSRHEKRINRRRFPSPTRSESDVQSTSVQDALPATPSAADLMSQTHAWAQNNEAVVFLPPDALEHRTPRVPSPNPGRFRMREPRSLKRAVDFVGKFMGGGPVADLCTRIRGKLNDLAGPEPTPEFEYELQRFRENCLQGAPGK